MAVVDVLNRDSNTNERGASIRERENEKKDGNKQEMRRGERARGPSGTEGVLINTEEARCESDAKRTGKKGGTSVEASVLVRLEYRIPRALSRQYFELLVVCLGKFLSKATRRGLASRPVMVASVLLEVVGTRPAVRKLASGSTSSRRASSRRFAYKL